MENFFKKFPIEKDLKEKDAIEMIRRKVECALEKSGKDDAEAYKYLAKAYEMLEFFFQEKGMNPENYV